MWIRCPLLLLLTLLSGCEIVTSVEPVGSAPAALDAEAWDGTWINAEAAVTLKVIDPARGQVQAAWIEEKEGELAMESVRLILRKSGERIFVSMRDDEHEEERYLFGRLSKDGGQISLWSPEPDAFAEAVEAGVFPGTVDEGSVHLSVLEADHLEKLSGDDSGRYFDWENPLVLTRIGQ